MSILSDLFVRIKGDSSGLEKTLDKSEGSVKGWSSKIGGWIKGAFAVGAILEFGRQIVNVSERLSDKFTFAIDGAKNAVNYFKQSIATMDFSGFLSGIVESYKEGKKLAEAMDELADRRAYDDFVTLTMKRESSLLKETIKNKELELSERTEAGEKRLEIEKDIKDRTIKIAEDTFNLESAAWKNRNSKIKMSAEEAADIVKFYQEAITDSEKKALEQGFGFATGLFGQKKGIEKVLSGEVGRGFLEGVPETVIQNYAKYLSIVNNGEKDVIQRLFETFSVFEQTKIEAQERYNTAIKETSTLLDKQNNAEEKITGANNAPKMGWDFKSKDTPFVIMSEALTKDNSPEKIARVFYDLADRLKEPMQQTLDQTNKFGQEWAMIFGGMVDMVSDSIERIGEAFAGGMSGKELGRELLYAFANFLSMIGKLMISAGIVMSGLFEALANPLNPLGWAALVGLGGAAILAAGLIKGAVSRGASGMSSGSGTSSGSSASAMEPQFVNVELTGELKGDKILISSKRATYNRGRST